MNEDLFLLVRAIRARWSDEDKAGLTPEGTWLPGAGLVQHAPCPDCGGPTVVLDEPPTTCTKCRARAAGRICALYREESPARARREGRRDRG